MITFINKKTAILSLVFLGLQFSSFVKAQENCTSILEEAEELFDQGIIEDIPDILDDCLKNGFSPQEKIRAQKLIILSYLFDNRVNDAERVMLNFLRKNPEYKVKPTDAAEFAALLSNFRTIPVISAGVFIGGNLSFPGMIGQYGPYNTNTETGAYLSLPADFQLGAGLNIFLSNSLELNLEGIFIRNSFTWSNLQYGFAQINKIETHQRFEFPLSLSIDLGGKRIRPYLRLGGSYGILMSAVNNYKREFVNTGSAYFSPLQAYNIDITNRRKDYSISVTGGGGIKYKIPRGHFYLDIRYFYSMTDLVIPDNRWEDELIFTYYTADNDFMLDYLAFSAGLRYSFYKPKKL